MASTRKIILAAAAATAVAAAAVYYYNVDPAEGPAPQCMLHALTGLRCPGCGTQRALHAALNGDFGRAWSLNPFLWMALPLICAYIAVEAMPRRWPRLRRVLLDTRTIAAIGIAVTAWWIGRNLAGV